jgi:futalosine hydrolase
VRDFASGAVRKATLAGVECGALGGAGRCSVGWVNRILIVTAVEAEAEAVRLGLPEGEHGVLVVVGGVGAGRAAAVTSRALALDSGYEAVLSLGIGGAFPGKAEVGGLLLARRVVAADLGADSPAGFLSVDSLGFGSSTLDGGRVPGLSAVVGTILTVNTVTGTDSRAAELMSRFPAAVGEAMEGYGVACAAALVSLPFAEVRAVSNLVGKRDRDTWRLDLAFAALTAAARPIAEGLEAC